MKASELRIGNYITVCHPKDELLELRTPTIEKANIHHLGDMYFKNNDWVYQPIPLTEEILLKCGFKKIDACFFKEFDIYSITLKEYEQGKFIINPVTHFNYVDITHLHQLQNLYFALTGEEIVIKE